MLTNKILIKLTILLSLITSSWADVTCSISPSSVYYGSSAKLTCDSGANLPDGYKLTYSIDGSNYLWNLSPDSNRRIWTYSINTRLSYSSHNISVRTYNPDNIPVNTATTSFTVMEVIPSRPSTPNATDGTYTDKVKISWNSNGAYRYKLYKNSYSTPIATTSSTYYYDYSVTAGTSYSYKLKACNSSDVCSDYSYSNTGYSTPPANQAPTISISNVNVESNGDVSVSYSINDPENSLMGTDIYLTTTSGGAISGVIKKGLSNRTSGSYSVTYPQSELSNLVSGSTYQIIADVFDNKGASTRRTTTFNYNYSPIDTTPTLTINTVASADGSHDQKTENFDLSVTVNAVDGLKRIAYGIYNIAGDIVISDYRDITGIQSTQTFSINISNLSNSTYKIKFLVTDINDQVSENAWYWFDKISINESVAYSVSPNNAIINTENIFTITGQNLPSTIYMKMDNATCTPSYDISSTSAKVKCTPNSLNGQRFYVFSKETTNLNDLINGSSQFSINVIESDNTAEYEVFRQEFINYDPKISNILKNTNMDSSVSRAEAAIMLEKFLSNKSTSFKNYDMSNYYLTFADVDINSDYHSSLLRLSYYIGDNDNITPISKENSLFRPLDKVSRQEFIAMVVQGLDLDILDNRDYLSDFKDTDDLSKVAPWAWKYFNTAIANGIMNGNRSDLNNPILEPEVNLSVFEAMVILNNAQENFEGKYKHTEAKFQLANSIDISKLLFNQIGYEYMPRYYENSLNPISITSVNTSTSSAEFCGNDNSIVLSVDANIDTTKPSKVNEYYWWSTNAGYFREYTGSSNFKKVCFYPATTKPVDGYKIVVNGGDNIGYVDSFTYTSLNTSIIHANDSDNDKVQFRNNISFTANKYMRVNSTYSIGVNGSFFKEDIAVGLENIKVTLIDGVNRSILFNGQAVNNKINFLVPDNSLLYGKNIKLEIVAHTQNAEIVRTLTDIKYLPIFSIKGKIYNTTDNKAKYVVIDSNKIIIDENNEFYYELELNNEKENLSIEVDSSTNNNFKNVDINLTYDNSKRFLVFVAENTLIDSDNDGVIDSLDDFPYDKDETKDTDNDGVGNNIDLDDDNDGISDKDEIKYGLNPLDKNDANLDKDNDGVSNIDEIQNNTILTDNKSYTKYIEINKGWNMISLPMKSTIKLDTLDNDNIKIIRSYQDSSWYVWTDNNISSTDKALTELKEGFAYWIKSDLNTNISVSGTELINLNIIKSDKKWHMGGSMFIKDINKFFDNNPKVTVVWKYINNDWLAISRDNSIKNSMENHNINLINSIKSDEGFMYK